MTDIPTAKEITDLAGLLVPGILILGVRSRFRDVSPPSLSDRMLNYAVVSIAYNAIAYPIFHVLSGVSVVGWLWYLLLYAALPIAVAGVLIWFDHSEKFYTITNWMGLRPTHHDPTAWDYAFRRRQPSYVLVHLNDGSEVAGAWTGSAFASSVSSDRDLLLDELWEQGDNGWEKVDPPRAMLICGGTIRMIEFIEGGR